MAGSQAIFDAEGVSQRDKLHLLNTFAEDSFIDVRLIEELAYSYSHCILIDNTENQIVAFAVALKSQLQLNSNKAYYDHAVVLFSECKTFTKLVLSRKPDISPNISISELVRQLKYILLEAYTRMHDVSEDLAWFVPENDSFDPLISTHILTLKILCKIFGVAAKIITNPDRGIYFTIDICNLEVQNFRPTLHFLALWQGVGFKAVVLIDLAHQGEEAFNIENQASMEKRRKMILQDKTEADPNEIQKFTHYLVSLSELCNPILQEISNCITKNSTIYLNKMHKYQDQLLKIRTNRDQNNLGKLEKKYRMQRPKILKLEKLNLENLCCFCSKKNPDILLQCQCFYHSSCLKILFELWFKTSEKLPIQQQYFSCVELNTHKIQLEFFLILSIGQTSREKCLISFEDKFTCGECQKILPLASRSIGSHPPCPLMFCTQCFYNKTLKDPDLTFKCSYKDCRMESQMPNDEHVICPLCTVQTWPCNFYIDVFDDEPVACKKCLRDRANVNVTDNRYYSMVAFFNQELINCQQCGNNQEKPYIDYIARCEHELCHKCMLNPNCPICGTPFILEVHQW